MNMDALIHSFSVKSLWGFKNIDWTQMNPDVNILVGVNGCGKSTLLGIMNAYYSGLVEGEARNYVQVSALPEKLPAEVALLLLRPYEGLQDLGNVISQVLALEERPQQLMDILDEMFAPTGKKADVLDGNMVFHQQGQVLGYEKLSTGEKQLLLILSRVYLSRKGPAVIFLDEPEISLHISWQRQIVEVIRTLNPQSQLFISSHSPSIFGSGWGDKVIYFEDIESENI